MLGGIYRIYSKATNESYYGSTRNFDLRFSEHKYSWSVGKGNKKIKNLYDKYGINNFEFQILEYCSREEFEEKERQYIKNDQKRLNVWIYPFSPKGCNLGTGVKGKKFIGHKHTEETKKNLSKSIKQYYENNDGYWLGKNMSEGVKEKVSLGLKDYFSKNTHQNTGKIVSEETKNKISESLKSHFKKNGSHSKGKVLSDETKLKISNSKKSRIK